MPRANGVVFFEGPSPITGDPIVAIVTGLAQPSHNTKTGPMLQAWILLRDVDPCAAVSSGRDRAICGDCEHRSGSNIGRSCYVIWWLAPQNIWKAFHRGEYPREAPEVAAERMLGHHVRIGAYGDPALVPYRDWLPLVRLSSGHVGYTQQWRTCDPMFARLIMASVQSEGEAEEAHALGWRTFRTRPFGGAVRSDETICPASEEGGHTSTCERCQLCAGSTVAARSVVIQAHGQRVRWFNQKEQTSGTSIRS